MHTIFFIYRSTCIKFQKFQKVKIYYEKEMALMFHRLYIHFMCTFKVKTLFSLLVVL